ncbi:hypothetical protein [Spiroplasma cantharicola]|uniref:MFS transporter n=1 Tax=Spiroplasma cantharicola TaxID=362837 RepID=A0A0M3SJ57_9MOLU|nr:hypothetical protein [Spiroplasma cantharicola]ALD66154.1 hypothetical protein SCANT_v1c02440 [Spiroplasma cantharicola]
MQHWDIKILFPILFIICTISIVFLCKKEKLQKDSYLWLIQTILFWSAAGYAGVEIKNQINLQQNISSTNFILASVFSTFLFLIILKPLATFTTGIIQNRKIWIQISSILLVLIIVLTSFLNLSLWILIIVALMLSFCLASSTLFTLFLNEQSFFRIYIMPSVWISFIFISFSSSLGIYFSNVNMIANSQAVTILFNVILILMLIVGFIVSLIIKENKNLVQVFDNEVLDQLPRKNNFTFFVIYTLAFLLTLTSAINNSLFIKLYIALNLTNLNLNDENVLLWLRINEFVYLIPTILASIVSYKFLRKIIEQKYLIYINMFVLFSAYTIMAFVSNPFIFILLNIITGICFNQIIYSLFSACVFWNYRAKKNPVTGLYGSSIFAAYFIVEVTQNSLSTSKVTIFKNFSNLNQLFIFKNNSTTGEFERVLRSFDNFSTLIISIACVIVLISILIFYFMSNKIFSDYNKYNSATKNLKMLIKKRVITKTKTKLNLQAIEEDINQDYE